MNKYLRERILATLIIFVLILMGVGIWWYRGLMPVNSHDTTQQTFIVKEGDSPREVANNLKKDKLIRDPIVFFLLTKMLHLDNKIQSGGFRLSPSQSAQEIAQSLLSGSSLSDVRITIIEGKRAEEIAELLKQKLPNYTDDWEEQLVAHEGYLFPDTYYIPLKADSAQVIHILTSTFDQKYAEITPVTSPYTQAQNVIIASLIERETRHKEDLPLVSSVIHNRLALGMPLQVDASIQFAKGKSGAWWKPVTADEYASIKSPYNTYLQAGLPPGPICNPGLAALQAAIHPAQTQYLYYITDKDGVNHYAKTFAQHTANINRYGLSE